MKANQNKGLIALSLVLVPYLIYAQTTVLEEVNIKEKKDLKTNSINVDLSKTEQEQSNSFFDMFKNSTSVDFGGGAVNAKRLYLRGLESSTLNISLDGARQGKNMFQHRGNELRINTDILKSVEVRTSSNAALGAALGGSIVMKTKDAQDFVKNNKTYGAIFKAGYATNTSSKSGTATAYQVFNDNLGAYINISRNNNENYKDGRNKEVLATAYKDRDYLFKVSLLNLKDNDLRLSINQNQNIGKFQWGGRGSDVGVHIDPNLLEKISSTKTNYTLNHKYNPSNLVNLDTNLNFSKIELIRKDKNEQYFNDTFGLKVQNHFDFDTNSFKNRVSLGFDLQKEEGISKNKSVRGGVLSKFDSLNKALFIQNRTQIDSLGINYGLRFDAYDFETGFGQAKDKTFSPNLGMDYSLNNNSLIYVNYGKNSRMTSMIPFTSMLNIPKNARYSKELKAEKATKFELGYKYHTTNVFSNEDFFSLNTNIFQTNIKNLINSEGGGRGAPLKDIFNETEKFKSKGFELQLTYAYNVFSTSLSYTQIDTNLSSKVPAASTRINENKLIRRAGGFDSKKFVWNIGFEPTDKIIINYNLNAIAGNSLIKRAGYTTHDINMQWKVSKAYPLTLFLAVNNLTNKDYAKHTTIPETNYDSGIYRHEMGRDFRFALKYEF